MNGTRDASNNFFDALLFEYQFNQALLTQKTEKRPFPIEKESDERLTKLFKGAIGEKDRVLHTKLFQIAENRQISFALPNRQQQMLRLDRSPDQVGFFDRTLFKEGASKIAPVISAFERRVEVSFTSFDDYHLKMVMGEIMLQALMRSQPGVHLCIVSSELKKYFTDDSLDKAYWQGAHTAFTILVKDPSRQDFLITLVLDLLQQSLNWKLPFNFYKIDYASIQAILGLLALFPAEKLVVHLQYRNKLFNKDVCIKLKTAITQHLRYGTATRKREEVVAKFEQVLAFLENKTSFASQLSMLKNHIKNGGDDPTNFIAQTLAECIKSEEFGSRQLHVMCAYYLLASKLCSIDLHTSFSVNNREYPSVENLLSFVKNMPHQLRGEKVEGQAKIIITTAQELETKRSDQLSAMLDSPIRSLICHGYNVTHVTEWELLCKWRLKIQELIKDQFPQEPAPFRAVFSERFTDF